MHASQREFAERRRVWGTAQQASQHQHAFATQLQREWGANRDARPVTGRLHLITGKPFAFIRIPRFGTTWRFAIVRGTGLPQLALGPGHVPGTALPGQIGNFAVAAHRVTAGNPFYRLNDLRPGDKVMIETAAATYTYQVTTTELFACTIILALAAAALLWFIVFPWLTPQLPLDRVMPR